MSNPDNPVETMVAFPRQMLSSDWLMSQPIDLPDGLSAQDISQKLIGTICEGCIFKGKECNPEHKDGMASPNMVAIDNIHESPDNGYGPVHEIPQQCGLTGTTFWFKDIPPKLELLGFWPT